MTLTLKHALVATFLVLSPSVPVAAGPLEDGGAAFPRPVAVSEPSHHHPQRLPMGLP